MGKGGLKIGVIRVLEVLGGFGGKTLVLHILRVGA
jgi:hypothetical protein